jgi:hypothetical protein
MGGLSFLNSGLLLFTAATVLPLLIWLLAKKKPKRIVFPTLRFIKAGQEQEKKRAQIKNIILLIIRMLIILLLTLAATRPLWQNSRLKPSQKHPPTALAVMLDTSYSMDYVDGSRTNLDRAKAAISRINALCTSEDRVILVTSDADWNRLHAQIYAGGIPGDIVSRIGITYTPIPLREMSSLAEEKLAETQLANRELYLITDGQKQEYPEATGLKLNVINVTENKGQDNLSCAKARVLPQLVERSRRQTIEFQVTNHGSRDRRDVFVNVILGKAKVAEKFMDLPARQTVNQTVVADIQNDGWQSGYVEVVDDRLEHDNRSYFSFPFQLAPKIAVVTSGGGIPSYLGSLLRVYAGAEGKIDQLGPQQLNISMLDTYQSYVFLGSAPYSPRLREVIGYLRDNNRGALFCLDREASAETRSYLSGLFGVGFGDWQARARTISYVNPHHFTTGLMAGKNIQFNTVADFWEIKGSGSTILIGGQDVPFALAKDNFVLWNFDTGSQHSTFFLDASFAVFAYRCLEYTGTVIAAGEEHQLGEAVSARRLILPSGNTLELASRTHKLAVPGIYGLSEGDGTEKVIAVNTGHQESEYSPMPYKGLRQVRLLGKDWIDTLFHTRLGHDLWKVLLALALALVILEIILVKTEESRSGAAVPLSDTGSKP